MNSNNTTNFYYEPTLQICRELREPVDYQVKKDRTDLEAQLDQEEQQGNRDHLDLL